MLGKRARSEAQIGHENLMQLGRIGIGRRDADEAIQLPTIQRLRIIDGAGHAVAKFNDPIPQDRDAPLAGGPVAGRKIMQHLSQTIARQLLAQHRLVAVIGKEILHCGEAGGLRGREAIRERQLVEEHGEVGGKLGHGRVSPLEAAA